MFWQVAIIEYIELQSVQFVFWQVAIIEYIGLQSVQFVFRTVAIIEYKRLRLFSDKSQFLSSEFSTADSVVFSKS